MNKSPLDMSLLTIDLDEQPCFQVMSVHRDAIGQMHKDMLWNLVEWAMTFNVNNYNDLFRAYQAHDGIVAKGDLCVISIDGQVMRGVSSIEHWRLAWRDFVMGWHRCPKRCVTVNRFLTHAERVQLLHEVKEDLLHIVENR